MNSGIDWLANLDADTLTSVDGLVPVRGYQPEGRPPEEVAMMEKAGTYGANAVFFEAGRNGRAPMAQAFVFLSDGPVKDQAFAELHKRLWSWGGVPLLYRKTPGLVELFRCAHQPDFVSAAGEIICQPIKTLETAHKINRDPWWDSSRLRNGTLWDDTEAAKMLLSAKKSAYKGLIDAVKHLSDELDDQEILPKRLRRKLLILSLLIAYLEEREVFKDGYLTRFLPGATRFFEVLADGESLVALLEALEKRFNGNVFSLSDADNERILNSTQLGRFADLVEGRKEASGQLTLWQLYSFKDLPVEFISHIYQIFVKDTTTAVYTPPFLVRLMLEESLSWDRLDRLHQRGEVILDPSCGSGVFLVEAYKRLVLHWRSRNDWQRPDESVLKGLLRKVLGVDLEEGAVELAAFSLCLALCDALEPEAIRASVRLFPPLAGKTLLHSCFFEAKEKGLIRTPVGAVVGNPPFKSMLDTPGAERSYQRYKSTYGSLPDKQLAYLFLHEAMELATEGGVLSMLQQYNFLYNKQSLSFRHSFIAKWDVREVLDFISIEGLFKKARVNTKVVVIVAEAARPPADRKILHATFRRSGRVDAQQGFDLDYYDLHWLPHELVLSNDGVWRTDLLGGGRVLGLVDRLKKFRTLRQYAQDQGWDFGEGFIEGRRDVSSTADHIIGQPLLPPEALKSSGIDETSITEVSNKAIERPRSRARFSPPLLLIREHMDLPHALWSKYLTYKSEIIGFAAPPDERHQLLEVDRWLTTEATPLRAYAAGVSIRLFTRKATALSGADILALPYPETKTLDLSQNERILVSDIVDYYRDLIGRGEDSEVMRESGRPALDDFNYVFTKQVNAVYKKNPLRILESHTWPGIICQPFVFGKGKVDWSGADQLKTKLDTLLHEQQSTTLHVTRVARMYDASFIFLLKPDRLRFWLRSVALRDADETLADLRKQGF